MRLTWSTAETCKSYKYLENFSKMTRCTIISLLDFGRSRKQITWSRFRLFRATPDGPKALCRFHVTSAPKLQKEISIHKSPSQRHISPPPIVNCPTRNAPVQMLSQTAVILDGTAELSWRVNNKNAHSGRKKKVIKISKWASEWKKNLFIYYHDNTRPMSEWLDSNGVDWWQQQFTFGTFASPNYINGPASQPTNAAQPNKKRRRIKITTWLNVPSLTQWRQRTFYEIAFVDFPINNFAVWPVQGECECVVLSPETKWLRQTVCVRADVQIAGSLNLHFRGCVWINENFPKVNCPSRKKVFLHDRFVVRLVNRTHTHSTPFRINYRLQLIWADEFFMQKLKRDLDGQRNGAWRRSDVNPGQSDFLLHLLQALMSVACHDWSKIHFDRYN